MSADQRAVALARAAALAADKALAVDLVGLDVSGQLPLTDVFLIATGRNERQVSAIAREIEDALIVDGAKPVRREGRADGRWVLLDFSDIVVQREATDNASDVGRVLDQSPSAGRSTSTDEQVRLLVGQQSGSSTPSETSGNGGG